ncbi:MAG: NAD(P)/FAD-dependent oxidoreductase [Thermoproteota archaeon]|nr:NAD(P)/FAD-dependent oxidoreductase [Candidatus Brockarchaeota archaeon]
MNKEKIAIIGAGIIGASIARVLSRYENIEIHLIEMETDVGWGVSKANTAILHAGYDDDPFLYPNRAKYCVRGNYLWRKWSKQLQIRTSWNGSLVLSFSKEDEEELYNLLERGERNGVKGLRIIEKREIQKLEENVSPNVTLALWAPTAGQISPFEAVAALVENAVENGVILHLETKVLDIVEDGTRITKLVTNNGEIEVDWVINAAGLYADYIAKLVGEEDFKITPRKGEYFLFNDRAKPKVSRILFPAPKPKSKGVVVTTTVDGNLMIGPNATDLPEDEKENRETTQEGLEEVWREASKLVKNLPSKSEVIKTFAGLRPEPTGGDFVIRPHNSLLGFINVAGIRSPGITSAPAIAYEVPKMLLHLGARLILKKNWNPIRRRIVKFSRSSNRRKRELIAMNPLYGNIVCQCEMVTEAEVVEAIRRGAKTVEGVKLRTRAGMGKCQGAFCRIKIAMILSRELKIKPWQVKVKGTGSEIGVGDLFSLLRK